MQVTGGQGFVHATSARAATPAQPVDDAATAARRREAEAGSARDPADRDRYTPQAREDEAVMAEVRQLAARDREVRAHERAHLSTAGGLARGGISLHMERGPDGRQYAVGGEVQIDTSAVSGDPQATIAKAQRIRRAALAPANPSSQDRRVAAEAAAMEATARAELAAARAEEADAADAGRPRRAAAGGADAERADDPTAAAHGRERRIASAYAPAPTAVGQRVDVSA